MRFESRGEGARGAEAEADARQLTLIRRGLDEAGTMIEALRPTCAQALRARLDTLVRSVEAWTTSPPSRIERAAVVNRVLELNLDVMKTRRQSK